jgi:hypothetical protein
MSLDLSIRWRSRRSPVESPIEETGGSPIEERLSRYVTNVASDLSAPPRRYDWRQQVRVVDQAE